ncbi:MAG: hypothetical protein QW404_00380 [Candidatus Nanoarchaeia archaeon]
MHPLTQVALHFITSATAGLLTYLLVNASIKTKNKQSERMAFALALFTSILIHIIVDYKLEWF